MLVNLWMSNQNGNKNINVINKYDWLHYGIKNKYLCKRFLFCVSNLHCVILILSYGNENNIINLYLGWKHHGWINPLKTKSWKSFIVASRAVLGWAGEKWLFRGPVSSKLAVCLALVGSAEYVTIVTCNKRWGG